MRSKQGLLALPGPVSGAGGDGQEQGATQSAG
jgi:hypothetical protein